MITYDESLARMTAVLGKPYIEERYNNGYSARARWPWIPDQPWASHVTLWEDRMETMKGGEPAVYVEAYGNGNIREWNLHGASWENPNGSVVPIDRVIEESRAWMDGGCPRMESEGDDE